MPLYTKKKSRSRSKSKSRSKSRSRSANKQVSPGKASSPSGIQGAKAKIEELNQRIQESTMLKRCGHDNPPMLGLSLDYIKDMNLEKEIVSFTYLNPEHLLLCLNYEVGCLASIGLEPKKDYIEIFSRTHPKLEGKKYNTLLRCVVMIIAPFLGIKKIVSNAIDPISAYLLCRYFDGSIVDPEYLSFKESPSYSEVNLSSYAAFNKHIADYTAYLESTGDSLWSIQVECPVNEMTQRKNDEWFTRYLDAVKCISNP